MMESSPFNLRRAIVWLCRLGIGGILIYAGYAKLLMPAIHPRPPINVALGLFAFQVDSYQLLSPQGVRFVAHTLPFAEIGIGLLLIIGLGLRIWAVLSTLLILGFFSIVLRAYLLHMQINCGCFATPELLTIWTVLRDGALLACAILMTALVFLEARAAHPWSVPERA
jgi:uncharacterized membrane protein YphA (DoxX/SURF4 family)